MAEPSSYPRELAGDVTTPPPAMSARAIQLARRAHQARLAAVLDRPQPEGWVMPDWRLAGAVAQLVSEANDANPKRDKSSDGTIGDARHAGGGPGTAAWKASDHNPWVSDGRKGVVRAADIDVDGLDCPAAAERIRAAAAAGHMPQVTGGGYVILNGRITAEDWSGWRQYTGGDPHVLHMHVSVSLDRAGYDDRSPWGVFAPGPAPTPAPPRPNPAPAAWTGPDLTGRGPTLRGQAAGQPQGPQTNGPRLKVLQQALAATYPLYRHDHGELVADGWYGPVTAAWIAEYARRRGITGADGLNIGPRLALDLWRTGLTKAV